MTQSDVLSLLSPSLSEHVTSMFMASVVSDCASVFGRKTPVPGSEGRNTPVPTSALFDFLSTDFALALQSRFALIGQAQSPLGT